MGAAGSEFCKCEKELKEIGSESGSEGWSEEQLEV